MNAAVAPVMLHKPLPPEEAARANFYALLARLFMAPPDGELLAALAGAEDLPAEGDRSLARAWRDLSDASSAMDVEAAREEYERLFVGVGKATVSVYGGFYSGAPSIDHPRVRIQRDLAALGLERPAAVTEPEDHFAGLLEVMRVLVAGGAGRAPASLAEQRAFHDAHLGASFRKFLEALARAPLANYYRAVAVFGGAFMTLEAQSFLLD